MNESLEKRVCAIYTRVSTEDQAREGFSLGEKKKRLTDYCELMGYQIYNYYEDGGISAKTGNYRPDFEKMLDGSVHFLYIIYTKYIIYNK